MRYTPGQFRDLVGLSQEALRHWRSKLPSLQGARGHGPAFTAGQVLAAAVVKALIDECGVTVGVLRPVSERLFEVCAQPDWDTYLSSYLTIHLGSGAVRLIKMADPMPVDQPIILFPMRGVVERLRLALLSASGKEQAALNFPPVSLGKSTKAARRG